MKNVNIILLSGGSGKRLWPLSNDVRSKQFIRIFNREDGERESMLMRVYRQIYSVMPCADVTIATSRKQVSTIRSQLGEKVHICVEPQRRDTFPAICLAASYLRDTQGLAEDQIVVVCPVDPYVERSYFESVLELSQMATQGKSNLCLMGIEPSYPSAKYGYILPEDGERISRVREFHEKPDEETAREYIKQGALWNGGVFAFRLGYLIQRAHEILDFKDYWDLYNRYEQQEKISFDYAIVEKEPQISVLRYRGQWKDLGSWNTFTECMEKQYIGKVTMDLTCVNTHVINELNIPVLCMGCRDMVVATSADGILVSDKNQSSYMKPYVEEIEQQVMYAEKSWGSFTVLDVQEKSMIIKVLLRPGNRLHYHSHEHRDEVWTVVSGQGRTLLDGVEKEVSVGDVIRMPAGCKHTIIADTMLQVIEAQLGSEISADDKKKWELPGIS